MKRGEASTKAALALGSLVGAFSTFAVALALAVRAERVTGAFMTASDAIARGRCPPRPRLRVP